MQIFPVIEKNDNVDTVLNNTLFLILAFTILNFKNKKALKQ